MDQMVIDLGEVGPEGSALLGAEAELFGNGNDGGPTADDWARAAGTINYEVVTRISPRVPRRFINEQATSEAGHSAILHREGAA
jgi:alanine racemase